MCEWGRMWRSQKKSILMNTIESNWCPSLPVLIGRRPSVSAEQLNEENNNYSSLAPGNIISRRHIHSWRGWVCCLVAAWLPACVWWVVGGRVNDGRGWMSFRGGRRTSRTEGRIRSPNRILVLGNDYGVCKC